MLTNIETAADAAIKAGFTGGALVTALAIAGAESNFNASAIGDVDLQTPKWGPSVGLWQIRSLRNWQLYSGADYLRDANKLADPYFNAKAAFAISKGGTDFSAWSTYTNNAYTKFTVAASDVLRSSVNLIKNNPGTTALMIAAIALLIILN
jgi:hypothetical protein